LTLNLQLVVLNDIQRSVSLPIFALVCSAVPSSLKFAKSRRRPGKLLLARIKQLIDRVCFDADSPNRKMRNECRSRWITWITADFPNQAMTGSLMKLTVVSEQGSSSRRRWRDWTAPARGCARAPQAPFRVPAIPDTGFDRPALVDAGEGPGC
jgi:hypothetical protein